MATVLVVELQLEEQRLWNWVWKRDMEVAFAVINHLDPARSLCKRESSKLPLNTALSWLQML